MRSLPRMPVRLACMCGPRGGLTHTESDLPRRVAGFAALVRQLPTPERRALRTLMRFLHRVLMAEPDTRMNAHNLGIVFGPNLLRYGATFCLFELLLLLNTTRAHRSALGSLSIALLGRAATVVATMIEHWSEICGPEVRVLSPSVPLTHWNRVVACGHGGDGARRVRGARTGDGGAGTGGTRTATGSGRVWHTHCVGVDCGPRQMGGT
jgi:hypothetical protein